MRRSERKPGRGLTLIETALAIGVVVVLAGVASPALASAKNRMASQGEFSQLRQLAVAQGLYTADTGGIPMSTLPLVQGDYVKQAICSSPQDRTPVGFANDLVREMGLHSEIYRTLELPYRSSYVGLREYHFPYQWMNEYVKASPGGGWLVSLTGSDQRITDTGTKWFSGSYRRLMLDGSVQTRRHEPVSMTVGDSVVNAEHDLFLFTDGSKEWKRSFVSGSH